MFQVFAQINNGDSLIEVNEDRIDECYDHFDIESFFQIALGKEALPLQEDDILQGEEQRNVLKSILLNGEIELSKEQMADPDIVRCAYFAQGIVYGAMTSRIGSDIENMFNMTLEDMMDTPWYPISTDYINFLNSFTSEDSGD